ncbi:nitrite reductase large subunit NirB [Alkalicoccus daliensis]|uniref:Nitrite reductase (NADH) large subunit n=1 Tax=Alkalicoccus daliensis TaxID=745820 RepID=A0A1H0FVA8_9BACI|nr:nitrite reductase large subunit NirB [Alkalicoccus daliensis]SDN98511.1 nitrite reductase (NADH) large subunit [Alkalicoccus daliensis]
MTKQKLVLIGNGMAGMNAVEKIINAAPEAFDITVFGKEPHPNYNRIMLSSVLQGDTTIQDIAIHDFDWYEHRNIQLYTGEEVTEIDKENQQVTTNKGTTASYDKLILATGSNPFLLPLPGADLPEVIPFRTLDDCEQILTSAKSMKKAVVIGGGLLGLEAARGLLNLGLEVDVVHLGPFLMERQLDETAAHLLQKDLEEQGMNFHLETQTSEILGEHKVEGVQFKEGTTVAADMVIMSVGVAPNVTLAKENNIETNRGILVNDYMQTKDADIYAVGECAEHEGMVYGLVNPLYEQADTLAAHITQTSGASSYAGSFLYTQLKISGLDVFSAGDLAESGETRSVQFYDEINRVYKKVILHDDRIQGAVLYGDVKPQSKLLSFITNRKLLSDEILHSMLFPSSGQEDLVRSLSLSANICQCNNVPKGEIIRAVQENGLVTAEEVKKQTKASSSCGGCKPMVNELLAYIQSEEFDETLEEKTLCSCTDKSEETVVALIQEKELTSIKEITRELQWKKKDGCSACIPVLHYYLNMIYPKDEEYTEGAPPAAMLQLEQGGTYSFSPQMYGGVTTPDELMHISSVAKKFRVSSLQLLASQRIQFSGVKTEDLSALYKELNTELVPITFSSLEPIQTFAPPAWPVMKKAEMQELAVSLEKQLANLLLPAYMHLRIGGTLQMKEKVLQSDVGLLAMEHGWEIYIGQGVSGAASELFYVTSSTEEVKEMIGALFQYYREGAKYGETFSEWAERVSFIHLREVLFDMDARFVLLESLEEAQERKGAFQPLSSV